MNVLASYPLHCLQSSRKKCDTSNLHFRLSSGLVERPSLFFYFVLCEKRCAYHLSMIYAGIMILNGLGHNVGLVATGRYFDGFAGAYTGVALVLVGPEMIYYLRKEMPSNQPKHGV
jgi:hypothetical protein